MHLRSSGTTLLGCEIFAGLSELCGRSLSPWVLARDQPRRSDLRGLSLAKLLHFNLALGGEAIDQLGGNTLEVFDAGQGDRDDRGLVGQEA
jgi:hypothetical protein